VGSGFSLSQIVWLDVEAKVDTLGVDVDIGVGLSKIVSSGAEAELGAFDARLASDRELVKRCRGEKSVLR
jgi:hypothetical protein